MAVLFFVLFSLFAATGADTSGGQIQEAPSRGPTPEPTGAPTHEAPPGAPTPTPPWPSEDCFQFSCAGQCGAQQWPPYWFSPTTMCYCDQYCQLYGDCCPTQHLSTCPGQENTALIHAAQYSECGFIIQNGMDLPTVFMVSKCPVGVDEKLKNECERVAEKTDSLLTQVPVYDAETYVVYKNVFCSQCHDVKLSEVGFWNLIAHSKITKPTVEVQVKHFISKDFKVKIVKYSDMLTEGYDPLIGRNLRACMVHRHLLGCGDKEAKEILNWSECKNPGILEENCHKYDYPVLGMNGTWYKNIFCALCDEDVESVRSCIDIITVYFTHDCFTRIEPPDDKSLTGLILPGPECPIGLFLDPLTGECRKGVMCRPGHIMWNNQSSCIIDPYNQDIYKPPDTTYPTGILTQYAMYTDREFVTVGENYDHVVEEMKQGIASSLMSVITTGFEMDDNGILVQIDMEEPKSDPLVESDGVKVTLPIGSKITVLFWHKYRFASASNFETFFKNEARFRLMQYYFHHRMRESFHVWTRNVQFPLTCSKGKLVSVQVDEDLLSYLKYGENFNKFPELVVEYDQNQGKNFAHLCDTLDPKFHVCDLLDYNISDFKIYNDRIIHKSTAYVFLNHSYYITEERVYVCVNNYPIASEPALYWITEIGLVLSNICLIITLFTYIYLPKLRSSLPGKLIINLCIVLFLAQLIFLIVMNVENIGPFCEPLAILGHYLWLSVFFWMNSIAINTFRTFRKLFNSGGSPTKYLVKFSLYSYLAPLVIVGICCAFHYTDMELVYAGGLNGESQPGICWIYSDLARILAFNVPLAILVLSNVVLFILTFRVISQTKKETSVATEGLKARDVLIYVKLSLLLGFTWAFGVLGAVWPNMVILYLYVILNSLSGFLIGVGFVCTKRVVDMFRKRREETSLSTNAGKTESAKYARKPSAPNSESTLTDKAKQ